MNSQSYTDYQESLQQKQAAMSKEEILEHMQRKSEHAIDLDNLPKQQHNWVERGLKVSCEGAMHPHHSHFLTRR